MESVKDSFFRLFHFSVTAGPVIMSIEERMEADARSIYVGNVCSGTLIAWGMVPV